MWNKQCLHLRSKAFCEIIHAACAMYACDTCACPVLLGEVPAIAPLIAPWSQYFSVEKPAIEDTASCRDREGDSNLLQASVILSKTIVGAGSCFATCPKGPHSRKPCTIQVCLRMPGIAAIPLTDAMLGWPLAMAFLVLMALATYMSLDIIVKCVQNSRAGCSANVSVCPWRQLACIWIARAGPSIQNDRHPIQTSHESCWVIGLDFAWSLLLLRLA